MSDAIWTSQLAEAIDSLADASQGPAFPSRCEDALEKGLNQGLSKDHKDELKKVLEPIRSWTAVAAPEFTDAFVQWQQLHAFGSPALPDVVLTAALRIYPKNTGHESEWLEFALATRRLAVIHELLDLELLSKKAVHQRATADPRALCKSRILEALSPDSAIWDSPRLFEELCREVVHTTSNEEIGRLVQGIINCYTASTARKATTQVLSLLSKGPEQVGRRVVDELFRRPHACLRFVDFLKTSLFKAKARAPREAARQILPLLTGRAIAVIEAGSSPGSETAGLALASLQLASVEAALVHGSKKTAGLLLTAEQTTGLLKCIAKHAAANSSGGNTPAFVSGYDVATAFPAPGATLKSAVPLAAAAGPSAVTTAHEAGTRRILSDFARLYAFHQDPQARDEALRIALFNHGVREFGSLGDEMPFDSAFHETRDTGVFPGDLVQIVRPGQEIVAAGTRHILVKAGVATVPDSTT
jgi:hypothetical protein